MTQPGNEPRSPVPLVNILTIMPMYGIIYIYSIAINKHMSSIFLKGKKKIFF